MAENKAGFSAVYDKKIQDLQGKLAGERGSAAGAIQEMKEMRTRWIRAAFFQFHLDFNQVRGNELPSARARGEQTRSNCEAEGTARTAGRPGPPK